MHALLGVLDRSDEYQEIAAGLVSRGDSLCVEGASGTGKSLLIAGVLRHRGGSALVITHNEEHAGRLFEDLTELLEQDATTHVLRYPSITETLYDGMPPDRTTLGDRLAVLERFARGEPTVAVASVAAVMHLTVPAAVLREGMWVVRAGDQVDRDDMARALARLGYERSDLVDAVGQFSVRGGIIDVFPAGAEAPVRVELFGDEVDTLRGFDPASQRSTGETDALLVGPAAEVVPDARSLDAGITRIENAFRQEVRKLRERERYDEARKLEEAVREDLERLSTAAHAAGLEHYLPFFFDRPESVLDYTPEDGLIIIDEPVRCQAAADRLHTDVERDYTLGLRAGAHLRLPDTACLSAERLIDRLQYLGAERRLLYLTLLHRQVPWEPNAPLVPFHTPPVDSFAGRFELLAEGLAGWQRDNQTILLSSSNPGQTVSALQGRQLANLAVLTGDNGDEAKDLAPGRICVGKLRLSGGFKLPSADLVVLTDNELYGWQKIRRSKKRKFKQGFSVTALTDLNVGDHVVHINHGIARYMGTTKQTVNDIEREYLLLQYAGEDRLYVPVTQMDRVQKYVGGSEKDGPTIHALKSSRWKQTKKRVRKSAALLARELIKLYREREQAEGFPFSPDSPWLAEMEASFRFEETPDQYAAIQDVKTDMVKPAPADRLICGDVGFGKTEVAIRAAFKAVLDGKQVAVLVPTTVLAQQHLNTFRERLSAYPVGVEMLSRFRTPEELQKSVDGLKTGAVDLAIGTHRLLNADIQFKDLGLVIIDEEQRFGVKQKERLKQLRTTVDVLTLTATPIPRTMHMALSSIRDISVINDPPEGRLPIRTAVREYDDELVRQAIVRELEREGQVFFVHNRVQSIQHVAARVQEQVPNARLAVAHGQLPEDQLEHVMMAFYAHDFDVLICTTIIESGLDVPNVNTLIVDNAHRLGLAQLYQLRGRVGRSDRQAYAYLLYRYPERMTEAAEQRLQALEEFADLGSGFKIAMRDLEIRGAGNLLGPEQSGHVEAVGLETYLTMLGEAVRSLKGEEMTSVEEAPTLDLPVEAVIPSAYVPDERQRISLYRRLTAVRAVEELEELLEEIRDRFGPLEQPVANLARVVKLRLACAKVGIATAAPQNGRVVLRMRPERKLTQRECRQLTAVYRPRGAALRAARNASLMPRAIFEPLEISFAYDASQPDRTFAAMEEIAERLAHRVPRLTDTPGTKGRKARQPATTT